MNETVAALLKKYDRELAVYTPQRVEEGTDDGNSLGHLRYMIERLLNEGSGWSDRKVNRWLGFIQGSLWRAGVRGISQLKDESRHLYPEPV
jgi:hypothetical protein